jgi:hypothetical protein
MNTAELKVNVISQITLLKEDYLVEEIKRLLDFELAQGDFKLSSKQKERITEAKQEYKKGKILSEKTANKQIDEWLKK